jgi:hypothetical protein
MRKSPTTSINMQRCAAGIVVWTDAKCFAWPTFPSPALSTVSRTARFAAGANTRCSVERVTQPGFGHIVRVDSHVALAPRRAASAPNLRRETVFAAASNGPQ